MSTDQSTQRWDLTEEQRTEMLRELLDSDPPPLVQQSIDAFRRDLPELLKTHRGKWVAYHGNESLGFGGDESELYQAAFGRGFTRDEFIVGPVEPGAFDPDEELEVLYWDV